MRHPFVSVAPETRLRVLLGLLAAALAAKALVLYVRQELPLWPPVMFSLALAGDPLVAQDLVHQWSAQQTQSAETSLLVDSVFLVFSSTALSFTCAWASGLFRRSTVSSLFRQPRIILLGNYLAWGAWLAALLGMFEGYALIRILQYFNPGGLSPLPILTAGQVASPPMGPDISGFTWFAKLLELAKLTIVELALIYIALAAAYYGFGSRLRARTTGR